MLVVVIYYSHLRAYSQQQLDHHVSILRIRGLHASETAYHHDTFTYTTITHSLFSRSRLQTTHQILPIVCSHPSGVRSSHTMASHAYVFALLVGAFALLQLTEGKGRYLNLQLITVSLNEARLIPINAYLSS